MLHYFQTCLDWLKAQDLDHWAQLLPEQIEQGLSEQRYGDLAGWKHALETLPNTSPSVVNLEQGIQIGQQTDLEPCQQKQLEKCFKTLIPWRKGPFNVFDMHIDTEWRSNWKWDRLAPHFKEWKKGHVLDVGCGNGYYSLRCFGLGAYNVMGLDPSPRFIIQFLMLKKYLGDIPVNILPIGIEQLPARLKFFDVTLSMGVLYHRRSPMDHLRELKETLKPGGKLVLETLVIKGKLGECLVPEERYAKMNNVWFLPSVPTLLSWLKKCGYEKCEVIDETLTTTEEQRATDWMQWHSLKDFLDPNDPTRTIEGHPGPIRAMIVAENPSS